MHCWQLRLAGINRSAFAECLKTYEKHIPDARCEKNKGNRQRHITSAGHNAKEIQKTKPNENPKMKIKGRNRKPRKSKGTTTRPKKKKGANPQELKRETKKVPKKKKKTQKQATSTSQTSSSIITCKIAMALREASAGRKVALAHPAKHRKL